MILFYILPTKKTFAPIAETSIEIPPPSTAWLAVATVRWCGGISRGVRLLEARDQSELSDASWDSEADLSGLEPLPQAEIDAQVDNSSDELGFSRARLSARRGRV